MNERYTIKSIKNISGQVKYKLIKKDSPPFSEEEISMAKFIEGTHKLIMDYPIAKKLETKVEVK